MINKEQRYEVALPSSQRLSKDKQRCRVVSP